MHDEAGADVHFHRVSPSGRVAAPPRGGASWIFRGRGRVDGYDGAPAIACAFSRRPATRPRSKTVLIMRVVPLVAARRPGFSDAPHPHEATRARLAPADRTSERRRFRQRWRLEGRSKRPTGIRCHPVAAPAAAAHVVETTAYGFAAFDVLACVSDASHWSSDDGAFGRAYCTFRTLGLRIVRTAFTSGRLRKCSPTAHASRRRGRVAANGPSSRSGARSRASESKPDIRPRLAASSSSRPR